MSLVVLDETCPTVTGFGGGRVPHPAYCSTSCDDCGTTGYAVGDALDEADRVVCEDCDVVTISRDTARAALRELDALIERTEDEQPDPLTDGVFQARHELADVLDAPALNEDGSVTDAELIGVVDDLLRGLGGDGA